MAEKITAWDAAEHLDDEEAVAAYLAAAFEDGDPALIAAAIGDVAKASGMAKIAEEAGVTREALYKSLSPRGNPRLGTLLPVLKALGMRIDIQPTRHA
ncbi:addiction module antidote protein [Sphingomonas cavernae]|uniref:Putative addiction module antidote protein n=1 Tax=Sphingomonas cavernae TaxID=2320861 RepID=A0A418WSC4_9SPHN|nr:addiction module antidote protein [Sphingomonas cavernae]RJF94144.1 putative addiction module antidote protein [Sphingomonas cavernae]